MGAVPWTEPALAAVYINAYLRVCVDMMSVHMSILMAIHISTRMSIHMQVCACLKHV